MRSLVRHVVSCTLLLFPLSTTEAAADETTPTAHEQFQRANNSYEAGKFDEALAAYDRLVQTDGSSPALAYNLGNTHYRLGHTGLAILWYERARRLAPRDEEIRFNLSLAVSGLRDREGQIWETLERILTPAELPWVVTVLIWLLFGIAGTALWRDLPWAQVRMSLIALSLLLVLAGSWWLSQARHRSAQWAVITGPTVEVRSGPGDQYAVGFTAPEGQQALILNRRPGWVEIGVPSRSLKGWVVEESLTKI